jgi:hypothetical protein
MTDNVFVVKNGLIVNTSFTANSTVLSANGLSANAGTLVANNLLSNSSGVYLTSNLLSVGSTSFYSAANSNIGIGTATPATKLNIVHTGNDDGLFVQRSGQSARLSAYYGSGSFNNITQTGDTGIIFTNGTQNTGAFVIAPWGTGTSGLRMDSSGFVGIGTANPSSYGKLTVYGSGGVNSAIVSTGTGLYDGAYFDLVASGASTNYGRTSLSHTQAGSIADGTNYYFQIQQRSTGGAFVTAIYLVDYKNKSHFWYKPTDGGEVLRINGSGYTGIGGIDPGYMLDVNGVIRGRGDLYFSKGSSPFIGTIDATNLRFGSNNFDVLTISTGRNVGIGTTNPDPYGKLTIIPISTPTSIAAASQLMIGEATQNAAFYLKMGYAILNGYVGIIDSVVNNGGGPLLINPTNGFVGIGLSGTPATKLHVYDSNNICIVTSQGGNGYGAFYAKGSGSNRAYLFMGNTDNGEQFRLEAFNGGNFQMSVGSGAQSLIEGAPSYFRVRGQVTASQYSQAPDNGYNGNFISTKTDAGGQNINMIRAGYQVWSLGYEWGGGSRFGFGHGRANDSQFFPTYMNFSEGGNVAFGYPIGTNSTMEIRKNSRSDWTNQNLTLINNYSDAGISFISQYYDAGTAMVLRVQVGRGAIQSIYSDGNNYAPFEGSAFTIISDYRTKENIIPLTNAIDRLNKLKPYRFNYIANSPMEFKGHTTVDGFLAHEVSDAVPEAVHGEKDAIFKDGKENLQALDKVQLIPLLTAALQEAIAEINALKTRITTLESKSK